MVGYWKILPNMETILVISCCVLLATGYPSPPEDISEQEEEIKLSSQPIDCKLDENKDTEICQIVSTSNFLYYSQVKSKFRNVKVTKLCQSDQKQRD